MIKTLTEEEFKAHEVYKIFQEDIKNLGIDMSKWYFGEANIFSYVDFPNLSIEVYFPNLTIEDLSMSFAYIYDENKWIRESINVSLD